MKSFADRKPSGRIWIVVLAALFVLSVLVLILYLLTSREPSYQGKTLSAWIVPFCQQTQKGLDAPAGPEHFEELQPVRNALSVMGTNALPFLMAKLNHRESALHRTLRQFGNKHPFAALRLTDPRVEQIRAIRGLAILGPAAQQSIPSLLPQIADPAVAPHAFYALGAMGRAGLSALADQLTNNNGAVRMQIALSLISRPPPNPAATGADRSNELPDPIRAEALARIITDPSIGGFRIPAIQQLSMLGPSASNSVSALLPLVDEQNPVVRQTAIRTLGNIKAQPDLVIPVLKNCLVHQDLGTRVAAVFALRAYGYETHLPPYDFMSVRPTTNSFGPGQPTRTPPRLDNPP